MNNDQIKTREGEDFGIIDGNYSARQIQAAIAARAGAAAEAFEDIEREIEDLKNNPDVSDIVDTYADLLAYDTSTLTDKDIIRVLNDETHDDESTYYRWNETPGTWTYIGSTGPHPTQSDWDEDDSADIAYIKNKPFYSERVESTIAQGSAENVGNTPDAGYVWYAEMVPDYALHTELADFSDGDTVYMQVTYSVNGEEKTDEAKFILTIENNEASLDSDMPLTSRWNGGYASEISGNTTFRWPVAVADNGKTIYITKVNYAKVQKIDPVYIPVDGETIIVNSDGELESAGGGGGGIPTDATFWGQSYDAVNNKVNGSMSVVTNIGGTNYTMDVGLYQSASRPCVGNSRGILLLNSPEEVRLAAQGDAKLKVSSAGIMASNTLYMTSSQSGTNYSQIKNLADPTTAQDAATKNYVDTAVASAGATAFPTSTFETILAGA